VLTYLTVREIATLYGVKESTVRVWAIRKRWRRLDHARPVLYLAEDVARLQRPPP
jgi:uncharacterized protein YjcR